MRYTGIIFILFFFTSCVVLSNKLVNDYHIKTVQPNDIEKKYQHLYIIGYGNTAFHVFFDNLSAELTKQLNKNGRGYDYKFLGSRSATLQKDLEEAGITNYDAIILLTGSNSDDVKQEVYYSRGITSKSVKVETDINIEIVEKKDFYDSVVSGKMFANINIRQSKIYSKISRSLIDFFKMNKVLLESN